MSQQLSTKAAATIYGRFINLLGDRQDLQSIFSLPIDKLRSVGLSYSKASYVKNISNFFISNPNLEDKIVYCPDDEVSDALMQIKGVGQWTVDMLLIFYLQREDVLPLGDLIVRKRLAQIFGVDANTKVGKTKITELMEPYRPHRSYLSRLMWISNDQS